MAEKEKDKTVKLLQRLLPDHILLQLRNQQVPLPAVLLVAPRGK